MSELIYRREPVHKSILRNIKKSELSPRNKSLILKFNDELFSRGLSTARVTKYMCKLFKLARWLRKDFVDANLQDIKRLVSKVERSHYVPFTKKEYKMCLKKLFQWMREMDEDYPPEVRWIKLGSVSGVTRKLPEDMITQEEVLRLINVARTARDRAFVSTLYESGCRIGELLPLQIGRVQFDSMGAQLRVNGKKGWRRIRVVSSVPYLTAWLNEHPLKDNPGAYLWIDIRGSLIRYNSSRMILDRLGRRASVKKRLNPHNFRHSRATFLANYLTEAQMKEYFGWTGASDMPAVYVHLSGRDVDKAILKLHGMTVEDNRKEEKILVPKKCIRCNTSNPASNKFCSLCGLPLDEKAGTEVIKQSLTRNQADTALDRMLEDPEFHDVFLRKAREVLQN